MVHVDESSIAGESSRRFRGNVDGRVVHLQRAVERNLGAIGGGRGLDVQDHLVAVPCGSGVEVGGKSYFGQPAQRIRSPLSP